MREVKILYNLDELPIPLKEMSPPAKAVGFSGDGKINWC